MAIAEIITVSVINIICFLVGAAVGKGAKVKTPAAVYTEHQEAKAEKKARTLAEAEATRAREEAEAEAKKLDAILENLERYDGTAVGQRDL